MNSQMLIIAFDQIQVPNVIGLNLFNVATCCADAFDDI